MPRSVSIVVPTHERADLLARSLDRLRDLRVPPGMEAETIVVANACTDATQATVQARASSFPFPLRLLIEPEPGLNVARNRGVRASRGDVVAFLDDDAFVEPGWLEGLVRTFEEVPADVVAGRVVLWWRDVARPPWISPTVERLLSCLDLGPDIVELARPGQLVGANFAVRRAVLETLGGFLPGLDRAGSDLLSGGDTELAARAKRAGHRLYYSPHMDVLHWVAPSRLERRYLDRVARARGRTRVALLANRHEANALRLVRQGCAQAVHGGWRELRCRLRADEAGAVAGRLARQRAMGTAAAALRLLRGGPLLGGPVAAEPGGTGGRR